MPRRAALPPRCLTQHGFAGPVDMIEGSGGFARAYADGFNPAIIEDGLGAQFLLMDVLVKSHAAAARVAAGIDAMLALRQQHGFSGDDIASMHLGIPKVIQGRLDQSASGRPAGGADVPAVQRRAGLACSAGGRAHPDAGGRRL